MTRYDPATHSSTSYNSEMLSIYHHLLEMARLAQQQFSRAVQSVLTGDINEATSVLENEGRIDSLEIIIDEECAKVLAKRQPAARDLRMLIAVSKSVADLERIGDESVKLAAITVGDQAVRAAVAGYADVRWAYEHIALMLDRAIAAYRQFDASLAVSVLAERRYREAVVRLLSSKPNQPDQLLHVLDLNWALRSLERIGDHSSNIAEQVIYLVTGLDVRHLSADQVAERMSALPGRAVGRTLS